MRVHILLPLALGVAALLVAGAPPADAAGRKTYEDKQRGFRVLVSEKFEQVPPKLTNDEAYLVGDWYADAAKFAGGGSPELQILWFATPKAGTITPKGDEKKAPPPPAKTPEEIEKQKREEAKPKSVNDVLDQLFTRAGPRIGGDVTPAKDLWKTATKVGTKTSGLDAFWTDVNDPDDRKTKKLPASAKAGQIYAFVARIDLDRPGETIQVGFLGLAPWEYVSDGKKLFLEVVKSFEDLAKIATDSRNMGAQSELDENNPDAFEAGLKSKMIPGWTYYRTPHYFVTYPVTKPGVDGVDPALAKSIGDQMESLRAQVYEVLFPADKPVRAVSVIRCCKDQQQYFAYGGPGGSAGYWYAPGKELVFYEMDHRKRGDSLRVLYHEGFHQYIYYSVGDMDPHSWFNEGDGDFFFGFNYENGKWVRGLNSWRKDLAKKAKREHKFPDLWEWLHWSQRYYYGGNKSNVPIGDNYALGWDFVYFLRTTKKKEYQGILDRYFMTLKGFVTRSREAREARLAEEKARREKAGEPPPPTPDPAPPVSPPLPPPPPPPGPPDEPADPNAPVPPPGPPDTPVNPVPPGPPDEPVPPADPAKPADPPKPADPAPPADPTKPPEPAKPADPAPPADPAKPADPPAPVDPTKPADPPKPVDPTKPPEPTKPADPVKPPEPTP